VVVGEAGDRELDALVKRLASMERPSPEAFDACDEIVARWGDSESGTANDAVLMALSVRAHMLGRSGRLDESAHAYDEVLRRFEQRGGAPIRLAHALYTKGRHLAELGRDAEAMQVYDTFLEEFGENPPPGRVDMVIDARSNRACCLADLGRAQEALAEHDAITARYGDEEDARARTAVAMSLSWKAGLLASLGRHDDAIDIYDQIRAYIGDTNDANLRLRLVSAYYKKGQVLEELGRARDALSVYKEAFDAFPEPERPDIDDLVAWMRRRTITLCSDSPDPCSHSDAHPRRTAADTPVDLRDPLAVEARLQDLAQMAQGRNAAQALRETAELTAELQATGAAAPLLTRAQGTQAAVLFASGATDDAIARWREIAITHAQSSDPELRRLAALAQHNVANMLICSGNATAGQEAMDKLVSEYGASAADALQEEAQRAELTGRPLDTSQTAGLAIATARILARCAPARVAAVTDPALAKLRAEARSPMRDELIAQLEQLRADACEAHSAAAQ
jgi:tetratricopeptide (TPR) repeat protein